MSYVHGNIAYKCSYCGGLNGMHVWAGTGGCPGATPNYAGGQWSAQYDPLQPQMMTELITLRHEVERLREMVQELLNRQCQP